MPHEFAHFGVSLDESRERFEEGMEQVRRLLEEPNLSMDGRFHSFKNVTSLPRPTQKPHPPLEHWTPEPGTGTAMIVVMGIGGTTASLLISTWGFFTRKGLVCLITLVSGSGVVFTLGLSSWVWLSLPVMVVMGLSQTHFIVSNQTVIQTLVPDTLRGRVSSVWHYEQGLIPLFAGVIGLVANVIGIGWAMVWFGGFALALGLFFLLTYDDIRRLD